MKLSLQYVHNKIVSKGRLTNAICALVTTLEYGKDYDIYQIVVKVEHRQSDLGRVAQILCSGETSISISIARGNDPCSHSSPNIYTTRAGKKLVQMQFISLHL